IIVWNVLLTAIIAYLLLGKLSSPESTPVDNNLTTELIDSTSIEIPNDLAKVVFINNDSLFEHFEMYKDLQDELLAEKIKLEGRYKRELEKLEKEYLELREIAFSLTQAQGEAAQTELMQKQQGLVKMEQDLTIKFSRKENELVTKIKWAIEEYLTRMQEEYGYDFVLGKSNMGGIHFANQGRDITPMVLAGLNREYLANKKTEGNIKAK
ncbi:MAG: OmpH family outer membrane protein, partial [Flavobacteriales bacterium]